MTVQALSGSAAREHDGAMVNHALLEQVLGLDESARRELRAVIDDSLDDGYVSLDEFYAAARPHTEQFEFLFSIRVNSANAGIGLFSPKHRHARL